MQTRMKNFLALSVAALALLAPASGRAFDPALPQSGVSPALIQPVSDAALKGSQEFIDRVAKTAIGFLGDESIGQDQRIAEFRKLLRNNFDMQTIGKFALGPYWKQATPAQQAEYQKLFETMVVEVYSNRFSEYKNQKLDVVSAAPEGKSDVMVTSYIVPEGGGDKFRVDWRVRNKSGYKIVDVVVEGVSMALTQRSDFASVIERGGGDIAVLIEHLRK